MSLLNLNFRWGCGIIGGGVFFGYLSLICYLVDLVLRFLQMKGKTSTSQGDNPDSSGSGPWTTQEPPPKY